MIIDRLEVIDWDPEVWPFTVPAVRSLAEHGLDLEKPITFLVGENGTGKSTIVEAVAEGFGIDVRGGHGGRRYTSAESRSLLGSRVRLLPPIARRSRIKSYFLRSETAKGVLEFMSDVGVPGYGERHAAHVSHGESFLQVLGGRFTEPGLYLLDEPEAPFSFRSCLALMSVLAQLRAAGAQIICATHSPLLTSIPDAHILELSDAGMVTRRWTELELTISWRTFLSDPLVYLRHLADDGPISDLGLVGAWPYARIGQQRCASTRPPDPDPMQGIQAYSQVMPDASTVHRRRRELEAALDDIRRSPFDHGTLELIVTRPAEDAREVLAEGRLDVVDGLVGDTWRTRGSTSTPDGSANPDAQITVMNSRVATLVAGTAAHGGLAGDQLYIDLDLSAQHLPAGSRLQIGDAVIEITAKPHRGCAKFAARFGADALRFVNTGDGLLLSLRGRNAKVVVPGAIRRGDDVKRVAPSD